MIWTNNTFTGYSVCSAAVVEAETPEAAAAALEAELDERRLKQFIKPEDMKPLRLGVTILCDGDY